MKHYLVQTGGEFLIVNAGSHEAAVVLAVKTWADTKPQPSLGLISMVIEVAEAEESYMQTEAACRMAGCWAGEATA